MSDEILQHIKLEDFPDDQYVKEESAKNTIYLHHTAGSANPFGVVQWWESSVEKVATHFIIGGKAPAGAGWEDGDIIQCYSTKYWGWHLGLASAHIPPGSVGNTTLNKQAVAIELCNWGALVKSADGSYLQCQGGKVPEEEVIALHYRGHEYYHAYTDAQIENLRQLLVYLGAKWSIPLDYKGDEMFEIDNRAFKGEPGIWTHTSVRTDKQDCSPQPKLIAMLQGLTS